MGATVYYKEASTGEYTEKRFNTTASCAIWVKQMSWVVAEEGTVEVVFDIYAKNKAVA